MAIWSGMQSAVIRNALGGTDRVIKMDGIMMYEVNGCGIYRPISLVCLILIARIRSMCADKDFGGD
jgi:hypothetical protein